MLGMQSRELSTKEICTERDINTIGSEDEVRGAFDTRHRATGF